jgi:hypothetical protein
MGLLQMDKSQDHGDDDDDDEQPMMIEDNTAKWDDEEDDDDVDVRAAKRVKKGKEEQDTTPHCDINFVKNTPYTLFAGDTKKVWGTAKMEDPAPKVPDARKDEYNTGDYLLLKGSDITLKHAGNNNCRTSFDPEEELILTSDWDRFDATMTGQDLVDLDEVSFLIWWQNVKPPPIPKPKPATVASKKKSKKGR